MAQVHMISASLLKERTPIEENVSDDLLTNYIFKSQETRIQAYLGTNLYNQVLDAIRDDAISGVIKTLLYDYIRPTLIEWSFYESMPFISLKITNKTIGRGTADYLAEGNLDDLKYLRNSARDLAEFYGERLIMYLKENSNLYPNYLNNSGLDKMQPQMKSYFGGIYLGGGRSRDCGFGLADKWKDL